MSTKCSISHSENHHLYKEVGQNDMVFLEIEKKALRNDEYKIDSYSVMTGIPIENWRQIVKDWIERGWDKKHDNEQPEFNLENLNFLLKGEKNKEKSEKIKVWKTLSVSLNEATVIKAVQRYLKDEGYKEVANHMENNRSIIDFDNDEFHILIDGVRDNT